MDKRKRRLLCMLEGGKKYRWIRGVPPLSFKALAAGTLENYRIYGNTVGGESVGDLVTSGEHAGEYKVPVTVSNGTDTQTIPIYLTEQIRKVGDEAEYIDYGEQKQHRVRKNLLQNTATSQTVNGVTFTVNSDGSVTLSGQLTSNKADLYLAVTDSIVLPSGEYYVSCKNAATKYYFILGGSSSTGQIPYTEIVNDNDIKVICRGGGIGYCLIRVVSDVDTPVTLYPMIRKADIEDDTYEPYIENTDLDVTLPALPTVTGTNVLSVGTAVQPSEIEVKGKIKAL